MRPTIPKTPTAAFAWSFFLLAVSFSVSCMVLKRDSLAYQTRDYANFVESVPRAWPNPGLSAETGSPLPAPL